MTRRGRGSAKPCVAAAAALMLLLAGAGHADATPSAPLEVNGFVGGPPRGTGGSFVDPVDVTTPQRGGDRRGREPIFVVEGGTTNNRVQRLDPDGNFELAWGRDVVRAGAPGDRGRGFEICRRAASCQTAPPGSGSGELRHPTGVATDPATGGVLVLDGGNRRVQRYAADGRFERAWSIDVGGLAGGTRPGAIAVAPSPPHDVFVADGATNRVLQFAADGSLLRGWGWGVADGRDRFQVCGAGGDCLPGRRLAGGGSATPHWPNHIAIDGAGIVYASVFLGAAFEGDQLRTRIERFDASSTPDEDGDATDAALPPLEATDDYVDPGEESRHLTNGATLGLELDTASGSLIAINNPFGTSRLDVVRRPGEPPGPSGPRVSVVSGLPFLQNVSGVALGEVGSLIYLSSGTLHPRFGRGTFTGCPRPDADRDCHGLIVLARGSGAGAVIANPSGPGPAAWVDADGAASSRIQMSRDGREWRTVRRPRRVIGTAYEPVQLDPPEGESGTLYRVRLLVTKRTQQGTLTTVSNTGLLLR